MPGECPWRVNISKRFSPHAWIRMRTRPVETAGMGMFWLMSRGRPPIRIREFKKGGEEGKGGKGRGEGKGRGKARAARASASQSFAFALWAESFNLTVQKVLACTIRVLSV